MVNYLRIGDKPDLFNSEFKSNTITFGAPTIRELVEKVKNVYNNLLLYFDVIKEKDNYFLVIGPKMVNGVIMNLATMKYPIRHIHPDPTIRYFIAPDIYFVDIPKYS